MHYYPISEKISMIILAVAGWFGIILQAGLMIEAASHTGLTVGETLIRFFSYFTILTNILVALSLTTPLLFPQTKLSRLFSSYAVRTAILVYIVTVGCVYMKILQKMWNPEGWDLVADRILHYFIPIGYLIFWIFIVQKKDLSVLKILLWLIYPFVYISAILIRGAASNFYPYPFLDVERQGYQQVFINAGLMSLLFLFLSLMFWIAGRFLK